MRVCIRKCILNYTTQRYHQVTTGPCGCSEAQGSSWDHHPFSICLWIFGSDPFADYTMKAALQPSKPANSLIQLSELLRIHPPPGFACDLLGPPPHPVMASEPLPSEPPLVRATNAPFDGDVKTLLLLERRREQVIHEVFVGWCMVVLCLLDTAYCWALFVGYPRISPRS